MIGVRRALLMSALAVAAVLPASGVPLLAQGAGAGRNRPGALRPIRRAAKALDESTDAQPNRNQQLQQQIRRTLWRVTKQRLRFSDDQMLRLERTTQRYDQQRRLLAQEEKAQRVALRTEILADSGANQSNIASALERVHAVQQRRLDLQAEEQKEFSAFMTPLQRAKFLALQEQVRRRLQDVARARPDSGAAPLPTSP